MIFDGKNDRVRPVFCSQVRFPMKPSKLGSGSVENRKLQGSEHVTFRPAPSAVASNMQEQHAS